MHTYGHTSLSHYTLLLNEDNRSISTIISQLSLAGDKMVGMWKETKHGLYKQFNFENFKEAWAFMEKVAELAEEFQHHPRWENEWSVVQIWLITHEGGKKITDKDHEMAEAIDALAKGHNAA